MLFQRSYNFFSEKRNDGICPPLIQARPPTLTSRRLLRIRFSLHFNCFKSAKIAEFLHTNNKKPQSYFRFSNKETIMLHLEHFKDIRRYRTCLSKFWTEPLWLSPSFVRRLRNVGCLAVVEAYFLCCAIGIFPQYIWRSENKMLTLKNNSRTISYKQYDSVFC